MSLLTVLIVLLIVGAGLIAIAAWFYERATNEVSLVKTGIGGRKVVIDGGTLAVPYFHEITRVNMQTLRLDVRCQGRGALITKDRMRVDVGAEFYTSVAPEEDAIVRAAQSLGRRLFQGDQLQALVEGMLVDALRSVAAGMSLDDLHDDRAGFVAAVRVRLGEVFARYGLRLDAVSLTSLDQTPFSALDENNAFNAVGMRKLAEVIARSKKDRAQTDAEAQVAVRKVAVAASRQTLEIDLEERRAQIAQAQKIEILTAAQITEVAQRKADSELLVAEARIEMERRIQTAEIERDRQLEIALQDRQISIAAKSQEESRAGAEADAARALAATAAGAVETAKATSEAERQREITLIGARAEAEADAARAVIRSEAERATAKDIAAAKREAVETNKIAQLAEAEAVLARIIAENTRSDSTAAIEMEKARLQALPGILAEMVKPAEKIKSINVTHLSGGFGGAGAGDKPVVNQALETIMGMAVQLPVLKKIGESVGLNFDEGLAASKGRKSEEE